MDSTLGFEPNPVFELMTLKSRGGHLTHFLPILAWGKRLYLLSEENEWDRFQAREHQAYKVDQVP